MGNIGEPKRKREIYPEKPFRRPDPRIPAPQPVPAPAPEPAKEPART